MIRSDTQSNVSSSTSDIVREARQKVEHSISLQLLPLYTLISGNFAFVLTLFECNAGTQFL